MIPDAPPRPPNSDPLIRHVLALPYFPLRIFLAKRVKEYPRFLYKFRPPIEPASVSFVRDLIVYCRLYLSSPIQFNDPFDMTAAAIFEGTPDQKRDRFRRLLADHAYR